MLTEIKLEQFVGEERERKARMRRAWASYHNEYPKPLLPTSNDPNAADNVVHNYARLIVDKGVTALFGTEALGFEVDGKPQTPQEGWLKDCWEANGGAKTLQRLGKNGGVTGHAFIRLMPANPGEYGHPFPRFFVWDTEKVDVRCSGSDYERVESYCFTWHGVDLKTQRPMAWRQIIERDGNHWLITDQEHRLAEGAPFPLSGLTRWMTTQETPWRFPWAPVFNCQNLVSANEFWGLADLEPDILDVIEDLNFTASNINRIHRSQSHQRLWATGVGAGEIEMGPDNVLKLPGQNAQIHSVEPNADLGGLREWYRTQREVLHEMSRIPEVSTGKTENIGQLSGVALQILYGPLVELTNCKRLTYGPLLQDLNRRMLELAGQGAGHQIKTQWPSVLPQNRKEDVETALAEQGLGVSRDTLLTRLGHDPAEEREKRQSEQAEQAKLRAARSVEFDRGGAAGDEAEDEEEG